MGSNLQKRTSILARAKVVASMLVLGVLFFFDPAISRLFPPCPIHWCTGLYCPGCGSLRAMHLLLHGNLMGAMKMNPLLVISLPFLALLVIRPRWAYLKWVPWAAFFILIVYGIFRNIPVWPFELLAPK
jgi:hypothetical protein